MSTSEHVLSLSEMKLHTHLLSQQMLVAAESALWRLLQSTGGFIADTIMSSQNTVSSFPSTILASQTMEHISYLPDCAALHHWAERILLQLLQQ